MSGWKGLVVAALLVALPGCLYVSAEGRFGADLAAELVQQVRPGTSTKADVLRLLGPPEEFVRSEVLDSILDEEARVTGAVQVGNRAHDAFTYQFDRMRARGTWLLLFGKVNGVVESDLVLVFFDEADVVREISVRRRGDDA